MRHFMNKLFIIASFLVFVPLNSPSQADEIKIRPRISELEAFPCDACHDGKPKKHAKAPSPDDPPGWSDAHDLPPLKHMKQIKNCSYCHQLKKANFLYLQDGSEVTFDQSYQVCEQCHREYHQWEVGVHGKQTGYWRGGDKERWSCTACHNPHNPTFAPMTAVELPSLQSKEQSKDQPKEKGGKN